MSLTPRRSFPATVIVVRPGERVGADGRVESGASDVDQASITGEPLPVTKTRGDDVFAGTVNGTGVLRVRVERAARDSVVARIVALVAEASATKARTQLFIEKIEQRYSVGVVAATLALFALPLAFGCRAATDLAARDDVHDRRFAVRGCAGDHAAAAVRDRERRTARSARQVRRRHGTARADRAGRLRQDRHPHRRKAPPCRGESAVRARSSTRPGCCDSPRRRSGRANIRSRKRWSPPPRSAACRCRRPRSSHRSPVEAWSRPSTEGGSRSAVRYCWTSSIPTRPVAAVIRRLQDAGRTAVVVTIDGVPAGVLGVHRPGASRRPPGGRAADRAHRSHAGAVDR